MTARGPSFLASSYNFIGVSSGLTGISNGNNHNQIVHRAGSATESAQ